MLWRVMVRHEAAAPPRHAAGSGSRGRGRAGQPIAGSGPSRAGRGAGLVHTDGRIPQGAHTCPWIAEP